MNEFAAGNGSRVLLLVLVLAGCAPGMTPVPKAEEVGGTTIVMRTADRAQCAAPSPPADLINAVLSAPLAYASDQDAAPAPAPASTTAADEESAPKRVVRHGVCWPGRQVWRGRRWHCE